MFNIKSFLTNSFENDIRLTQHLHIFPNNKGFRN